MTLDSFLAQLENVTPRGSRYRATCPAHRPDRSPSLQVTPGDTAILLKCWAGCSLGEICASLGIEQRDLFFDGRDATSHGTTPRPVTPPPARIDRKALAFKWELAALDLRLRADAILQAANRIDVSGLSDEALDRAMQSVTSAYADRDRAELFEYTADGLMERHYAERTGAR